MGGGRCVAPRLARHEPKKTGARSARARTRGQNPLVIVYSLIGSIGKLLYYWFRNFSSQNQNASKTPFVSLTIIKCSTLYIYYDINIYYVYGKIIFRDDLDESLNMIIMSVFPVPIALQNVSLIEINLADGLRFLKLLRKRSWISIYILPLSLLLSTWQ